jgi:hypothetical protein
MSDNDPDFDGYRKAFKPQVEDKWKDLKKVSLDFEHPASPRMNADDPSQLREEISRRKLPSGGPWATIMFIYRERRSVTKPWGLPRLSFQKFVKRGSFWHRYAVVNLSNAAIVDAYEFIGEAWDVSEDDDEGGQSPPDSEPEGEDGEHDAA